MKGRERVIQQGIDPSVRASDGFGASAFDRIHMIDRRRMKSSLCVWGPTTARNCLTPPRILGDNPDSIR
jgi:hypothetical protein